MSWDDHILSLMMVFPMLMGVLGAVAIFAAAYGMSAWDAKRKEKKNG